MQERLLALLEKLNFVPEKLRQLSRWPKRAILISHDITVMLFALWLGMSLRLSTFYIPEEDLMIQFLLAPIIAVVFFHYMGLYKLVTRYMNQEYIWRIAGAVTLSVLFWSLILIMMLPERFVPRSVIIIYLLFSTLFLVTSRLFASWLLGDHPVRGILDKKARKNVLIYGVSDIGFQLLNALLTNPEYLPVGFIDHDETIQGQRIKGLKIYPPKQTGKLIAQNNVKEIFLAMTELSYQERSKIIAQLQNFPVTMKKLPHMRDITDGRVQISDLKPIKVEDLLYRDVVPPNKALLSRNIKDQVVMVTGAGGSIGSEISRQVLLESPKKLILLDNSEVALYHIDAEITGLAKKHKKNLEIISILGSILDEKLMRESMADNQVETIYHAAAYKHVPIVEKNPVVGIKNNTFGTLVTARIAREENVKCFVLISTDKAVRPTNIMGASKRLAEQVLQALADEPGSQTIFTMVRFGNVLASSGSVVRKFSQQITDGGPVTVTDKDIIRYFMSIPEAAQLVIQAGAMARGGEVYILDMGEPVKIMELAFTMVHLAGLQVIDDINPDGDIKIEIIGLRPGEKLYEELSISKNTSKTEHPRIFANAEKYYEWEQLSTKLNDLEEAMKNNDFAKISAILIQTVEGYSQS